MILPDVILPSRINKTYTYFGLDDPKHCLNLDHFNRYPDKVEYVFNSRGFRDKEWPDDLTNTVWCLGDSLALGMGLVVEKSWPKLLEVATGRPTINISLDGASNDWLARKACSILTELKPEIIVIQWTFLHRGECSDDRLSDEDRRLQTLNTKDLSEDALLNHFVTCLKKVQACQGNSKIIHSFIPEGFIWPGKHWVENKWNELRGDNWPKHLPDTLLNLDNKIIKELENFKVLDDFTTYFRVNEKMNKIMANSQYIQDIGVLDYGRDGYHSGVLTAEWFAKQVQYFI